MKSPIRLRIKTSISFESPIPEAAFTAADRLGFYYQVECSTWPNQGVQLGLGQPIDEWLYREGDRILAAYGNHPSFAFFCIGNEFANQSTDWGAVNTLIGSVVLVLVFVFAAWLVTRTLSSLYRGRAAELDLLWIGLRASALIAVAIYVVN